MPVDPNAREKVGMLARRGRKVANHGRAVVAFDADTLRRRFNRTRVGNDRFEIYPPKTPGLLAAAWRRKETVERADSRLARERRALE